MIRASGSSSGNFIEHVIDTTQKCFVYNDSRSGAVKPTQVAAEGTLIPAKGEATDDVLRDAVVAIAKGVPTSSKAQVNSGDFNNCFDFAAEAVRRMGVAGYLSAADAQKFATFHSSKQAAVKAKTNAGTEALCTRAGGGACAMRVSVSTTVPTRVSPDVWSASREINHPRLERKALQKRPRSP